MLRDAGIVPVNELFCKRKYVKFSKLEMNSGTGPLKPGLLPPYSCLLLERERYCSDTRPENESGMLPCNKFWPAYRIFKFERFAIEEGRVPVNLLLLKSNVFKFWNRPKNSGMVPLRKLLSTLNIDNDDNLENELGIVPMN